MFQTSNYTLNTLKSAIEDKVKEEENISDSTVARAVYKALKTYFKFERRLMSDRWTQTETVSVTSAGYDVQTIGISGLAAWATITAYTVGDVVKDSGLGYVCVVAHTSATFSTDSANWERYYPLHSDTSLEAFLGDTVDGWNLYPNVTEGSDTAGWYIKGDGKIYTNPLSNTAVEMTFRYIKSPVLISVNTVDMTQTLPIVQDSEDFFEEFVLARFFRREGEADRSQDAEARFGEQLQELFGNTNMKAILL